MSQPAFSSVPETPYRAPTDDSAQRPERSEPSIGREVRTVGRHSLIYLLAPALSNAVGFILVPVYSHLLSTSDFGVMSLVDVWMTLTMMLLSLGMSDAMNRFFHAERDVIERQRIVITTLVTPVIFALPVIFGGVLASHAFAPWIGIDRPFVGYLRGSWWVAWCSMIAELGYAYLRLVYRSKTYALLMTMQILLAVGLNIWLVVFARWGIQGILISTLCSQGFVACCLVVTMVRENCVWPSWSHGRRLVGFGIHLVPSIVSLQLTNYLNPVMIRWLSSADPTVALADVGLYALGQKLAVVVNRFVTVPFHGFWRPRRMELMADPTPNVLTILARICTYSTLITAQVALLLSVLTQPLLQWVMDPKYVAAHRVVPWIAASYVMLGLEHHFSTGLHYARKTWQASWIGLASLLLLIVINTIGLRWGDYEVAAIATGISISARSGLFLWASQRCFAIPFEIGRLLILGLVAVALYGTATSMAWSHPIVDVSWRLLWALAFGPLLMIIGFFQADEISGARRWLHAWLPSGSETP